jgi:oligosaccharide translocation protein RFT1
MATTIGRAAYLVANQVVSRGLTFVLNALIVRAVDPSAFGVVSVRLNLVLVTVVSLVRDTLRQTGARVASDRQLALNLAWLAPLMSAVLMCGVIIAERNAAAAMRPGYAPALALYCAASVVEALAEPAYVAVQAGVLWGSRAVVEGAAHLVRCVCTYVLLAARGPDRALEAFALAQLAYACVYSGGYWLCALRRGDRLAPRARVEHAAAVARRSVASGTSAQLLCAYAAQQLAKYALTHGESMVLLARADDASQGVYALVMNLGSLLARFLLEPAEETAFAQLAPHAHAAAEAAEPLARGAAEALRDAGAQLARAARRLLLIGCVFAAFGPAYARLLLQLVYGPRWASGPAPALLASYCAHLPAMALNGTLEAAVRALATPAQLRGFNGFLGGCAVGYWLAMGALLRAGLGLHGVVVANALNLGARCAHHVWLLARLFGPRDGGGGGGWSAQLAPTGAQCAMLAMAALAVNASALRLPADAVPLGRGAAAHVAIGAVNFLLVALALLHAEGASVGVLMQRVRGARAARGVVAEDAALNMKKRS